MNSKGFLLATAAGAAFAPVAQAADMPLRKAPAYVEPPANWAGWYIGVHAGVNWHQANTLNTDSNYGVNENITQSNTGFIGGGQIGYNWQHGSFVFGLEADGSWLSSKINGTINSVFGTYGASNDIRWMSTVRARFGLAFGDTMGYLTGGVAFGGTKDSYGGGTLVKSQTKTQVGWAIGGGVEHMLGRNWTIGAEALFVDLGKSTFSVPYTGVVSGQKTTRFSNQAVIGRLKLNYKF